MADEPIEIKDYLLHQVVEEGLVTPDVAAELVEEHKRTGTSVRELLIDMEVMSEDMLLDFIARQMSTYVVDIAATVVSREVARLVPASSVRMYSVVPIEAQGNAVTMATSDLLSPEVIDELNFVLAREVTYVVAKGEDIRKLIADLYGNISDSVGDMLSQLEAELQDAGDILTLGKDGGVVDLEQMANQAPIIRFVNLVLYQGVQDRASDIHFEPFEKDFKIRYRVDGALYEMAPPPRQLALPVISRVKVIAGLNIAERRVPQDGRIKLTIAGRPVDFRVSTLPTQYGESVVLRILDQTTVQLDVENVGMPEDIYETFAYDITKPNGIIIVTGPTGSGKTTTLYAALKRLNTIEDKLLTAEDPVEYDIEGIIQIPIQEAIGLTFARVLRSFLRQDPDIILVGEIRDKETAEIAIQASLTGHLVFSTLHTNDASGAITRLIDMGVEPFLISSTLEAVLGQRLVRTICPHCKTPFQPEAQHLDLLNLTREQVGDRPFYFGAGCKDCNQTGYRGRRGIFEYLRLTEPIQTLVNQRKPTLVIRDKAVEMGMRTLRDDGIRCVLDGYTTMEEILKYT
ncbi:MAG: Flp pilus assembly complex ATPase component TadA [Verrucomicrobia bacterium]|nr:Flp pilus assembly complex ATPase component TadA [Verrucomicrobiota bacterium]